jgi:hypothetical protein
MSCIIAGVLFCCTSLITVSLLAGLVPQQTQEIDVLTTLSQISIKSSTITTSIKKVDPSECIEDECNPRLSSNLEVHSYELEYIYNHTNETTVQGYVAINFTLKEPINQLIYHAKRMVKLEEPLLYEDGVHRLVTMRTYPPNDYISLRLVSKNSLFAPNRYSLKQKFVVSLIDGSVGFYQSTYKDSNGTTGYTHTFFNRYSACLFLFI